MTQATQPQPVQTPEQQPNFLRRGLDAASSMPFVLGARTGAENTAERLGNAMPTRAEAIAIGTVVLVAPGVGASVANASNTETATASSRNVEACTNTALNYRPHVGYRVTQVRKAGNKKSKPVVRIRLNDKTPQARTGKCEEYEDKPRNFRVRAFEKIKGSKRLRKISRTRKVELKDGKQIGNSAFLASFELPLRKRPNPANLEIRVTETVYPKGEKPKKVTSRYKKERIPVTREPI